MSIPFVTKKFNLYKHQNWTKFNMFLPIANHLKFVKKLSETRDPLELFDRTAPGVTPVQNWGHSGSLFLLIVVFDGNAAFVSLIGYFIKSLLGIVRDNTCCCVTVISKLQYYVTCLMLLLHRSVCAKHDYFVRNRSLII